MEELIREWDGAFVVTRHDRATGATIHIAVHTTEPEAAAGGTRMRHYGDPTAALRDALRLGSGMSLKFAALELPRGGGKAVLDIPDGLAGEDRDGLLDRYADLIGSLRGVFETGPDMGTTPADMDRIAARTPYVFGTSTGAGDPGPYTARGVFEGIRACVAHRFGSDSLAGRSVLVQGVGSVGGPLAGMLEKAGARILFTDLDEGRRPELEARGFQWVERDAALATECDVLAPCATGAVMNHETIPRLACAIVAGSANNVLEATEDAARLQERGILYAPDFLVNGGGAVYLVGVEGLGWDAARIDDHIRAIGTRVGSIIEDAERDGITTHEAAVRFARRRMHQPRS